MTLVESSARAAEKAGMLQEAVGLVHCPMCSHRVEAIVQTAGRSTRVKPGQRCPRCKTSIDAASVLRTSLQTAKAA